MNISEEGMAVTARFFKALGYLKDARRIRGIQTFTKKYNINRWNLYTVRDNSERSILKPEWCTYLVRDYGISAEWLLTGEGSVFKMQEKK